MVSKVPLPLVQLAWTSQQQQKQRQQLQQPAATLTRRRFQRLLGRWQLLKAPARHLTSPSFVASSQVRLSGRMGANVFLGL